MDKIRKHPVIACWLIFMICAAARIMEYFFIKTDESFLAENSIHKLFGIFLLFVILSISKMKWKDIGFVNEHAAWNCGKGILLGSVCFTVAYGMECLILYIANQNVKLEFYASGFSLNGGTEKQTGILFVLICIAFNIINVWMEEGVFRGLFTKFLENFSVPRFLRLLRLRLSAPCPQSFPSRFLSDRQCRHTFPPYCSFSGLPSTHLPSAPSHSPIYPISSLYTRNKRNRSQALPLKRL